MIRVLPVLCVLVLTACGGTDATTQDPGVTGSPDETTAAEQEVDSIRVVLGEEPETDDPCQTVKSSIGRVYHGNVAEPLVKFDPDTGEMLPGLAASWEAIDPTTWQFTVQEGVTFHNGEPFTAESVVTWMDRVLQEDAPCYVLGHRLDAENGVVETTAIDDQTVEFRLGRPDPIFHRKMGDVVIGWLPDDLEVSEQQTEPIGTGPYEFVSHERGTSIRLTQNTDYWGDAPEISDVEFLFREESAVRAAMAETGEVDIAMAIGPQDADAPGAITYTLVEVLEFRFDSLTPPLDDLRVRKAINHGIDRQTFIDTVFGGNGEPAHDLYPPTTLGYNSDVGWEYDPDLARQLVEEARADGVPVDTQIEVISLVGERNTNGTEVQDTIAIMLNDIGLNAIGVGVEVDERIRRCCEEPVSPDYAPAMVAKYHGNATGDASATHIQMHLCDAEETVLCDEALDEMLSEAFAATGEREQLFQDTAMYIHENVVAHAPIAYATDTIVLANDDLEYTPNPLSFERLLLSEISVSD